MRKPYELALLWLVIAVYLVDRALPHARIFNEPLAYPLTLILATVVIVSLSEEDCPDFTRFSMAFLAQMWFLDAALALWGIHDANLRSYFFGAWCLGMTVWSVLQSRRPKGLRPLSYRSWFALILGFLYALPFADEASKHEWSTWLFRAGTLLPLGLGYYLGGYYADRDAALAEGKVQKKVDELTAAAEILHKRLNPRGHLRLGTFSGPGSHQLDLKVEGDATLFYFSDRDRDEPLKPLSFALNLERLLSFQEAWVKGQRGQTGTLFEWRKGQELLRLEGDEIATEDAYGPHLSVTPDSTFSDALTRAVAALQKLPRVDPATRLRTLLDNLAAGSQKRFEPAIDAALLDLRENPDLDEIVRERLQASSNADLTLFCVAFLFERSTNRAELVKPLLDIVEARGPSEIREAAESSILACCAKNPELLDAHVVETVVVRLPAVVSELRAFGSSLRILEKAGSLSRTAQPYLLEVYEDVKKRNGHRPELAVVLDQMNRILAF